MPAARCALGGSRYPDCCWRLFHVNLPGTYSQNLDFVFCAIRRDSIFDLASCAAALFAVFGKRLVEEESVRAVLGQARGVTAALCFLCSETKAISALWVCTRRELQLSAKCRAVTSELQRMGVQGRLWTGLVVFSLPGCAPCCPPSPCTDARSITSGKCFFLFFGRMISLAPVLF